MNSSELISAIAGGDRSAFKQLYRARYAPMVTFAGALLGGDRAGGEDAVDDAFLDIWRSAASFSGAGSADGWIRRIVRNKVIDQLRKRREVLSDDPWQLSGAGEPGSADPTPFDAASAAGEAQSLRLALSELSPDQREVVWLCYYEELPLRDIAVLVGCPENTVKTRLFHARQRMRHSLAA